MKHNFIECTTYFCKKLIKKRYLLVEIFDSPPQQSSTTHQSRVSRQSPITFQSARTSAQFQQQ